MKKNIAEFLEFRFEKLKLLKQSDKGEVWLAAFKQSGELVVIKRMASTGLPYELIKNFLSDCPRKFFSALKTRKKPSSSKNTFTARG